MKLANKGIGLLVSVVGGVVARSLFKKVWQTATGEEEAPKPTDARRGWGEILAAAAVQGAIFAVVQAALDRGTAEGTSKLTGVWPGENAADRDDADSQPGSDEAGKQSGEAALLMTEASHPYGRRARGTETIPPQSQVSGGPDTPLEIGAAAMAVLPGAELNAETEREAAAQAGHPGAQAAAEELGAPAETGRTAEQGTEGQRPAELSAPAGSGRAGQPNESA